MIRKPGAVGEVIYPSELDVGKEYYGFGSFFLSSHNKRKIDSIYSFWAIWRNQAVETKLERQSSNVFRVQFDGVGKFEFRARNINSPARYTGQYRGFDDKWLIRQLAPFDHELLDAAILKHDFYFVGFTPKLDIEA